LGLKIVIVLRTHLSKAVYKSHLGDAVSLYLRWYQEDKNLLPNTHRLVQVTIMRQKLGIFVVAPLILNVVAGDSVRAVDLVDSGYRFYNSDGYQTTCLFRLNKIGSYGRNSEWVGRAYCNSGEEADISIDSIYRNGRYVETLLVEVDNSPFDFIYQGNKEDGYYLIDLVPDGVVTGDTNYDEYIYSDM
jgi:hypothetical protein